MPIDLDFASVALATQFPFTQGTGKRECLTGWGGKVDYLGPILDVGLVNLVDPVLAAAALGKVCRRVACTRQVNPVSAQGPVSEAALTTGCDAELIR